jgi:hypothetical protein
MACPIDSDTSISDAAQLLVLPNHHGEPAIEMLEPRSTPSKPFALPKAPLRKRHNLTKVAPDHPQTKRRRLSKRSVRFGAEKVFSYDKVSGKDVPLVWWTGDEIRHIHRRERSMVRVFSYFCGVYVESLTRLTEVSSQDGTDVSKEGCFVLVANSPGRGLEGMVSTTLTGSKNSKMVIGKIVETQQHLRDHCMDRGIVPSPELFIEILRHQYESLSFPKKRFAQFLAAGDAIVARFDEKDEDAHECSSSTASLSKLSDTTS